MSRDFDLEARTRWMWFHRQWPRFFDDGKNLWARTNDGDRHIWRVWDAKHTGSR